jgi:ABC-2 type transport system ATP-binding protein
MNKAPSVAIETLQLVKHFGEIPAVDGINLFIPSGGVYGFLGPNGAGKTTTIRMLATLLRPDSGTAKVFGRDIVKEASTVRSMISLTGQFASVDEDLTGRENLILLARLHGYSWSEAKKRASELLEVFDLSKAANRLVKTYSGGMQRRIDITASLIVAPKLLFLDEPTAGLDPHSRNQIWTITRGLVSEGTTVLLTTQHLEEADQLANRIAVIDHGKIIAEGTSSELKSSIGLGTLHIRLGNTGDRTKTEQILSRNLEAPIHLESDPFELSVRFPNPERITHALAELTRSNIPITSFSFDKPSLDEVFLALTKPGSSQDRSRSLKE